jgi:hypothetical protein
MMQAGQIGTQGGAGSEENWGRWEERVDDKLAVI